MTLNDYSEKTKGIGIMSTAARDGEVTTAIYSNTRVTDWCWRELCDLESVKNPNRITNILNLVDV